jgi:septum formation protein
MRLLSEYRLAFEVFEPHIEEVLRFPGPPEALVAHNAQLKAGAAPPFQAPTLVLGADTVVVLEDRVLGKPASWEAAQTMLEQLNGRSHTVLTGIHLRFFPETDVKTFVESTRVHFHHRSASEREAYLQRIQPLDKAGAYAAQEDNGEMIASIEGSKTNVIGLPMERLLRELAAFHIVPAPSGTSTPQL